ncbi:kinase-like protein [Auricularia subglabra TFB-10046 SS5]|nr:kinase-like protein [Auricularia subglabra TFB-10046 SS5]
MCGQPVATARPTTRAENYFQLLAHANEAASRPATPPPAGRSPQMAQGYFDAFFRVEQRLGMGASGAVFLVQHVIDGNELGRFALKRIAVGSSSAYLLDVLREVRLLESLRHDNVVTYHHAWLESYQWSSFQAPVPTLHILMQWADGGSLDDLIEARLGGPPPATNDADTSREARIARHRARTASSKSRAVHFLSAEEVRSLFTDVASGLGFLHERAILHLDLKPGNVLLTFEDGRLIPRALLSDFGTALDSLSSTASQRERTGNTGTLEYAAPETLASHDPGGLNKLRPMDAKADMWSLGMILYVLVFFRLPWKTGEDRVLRGGRADSAGLQDELEEEIRRYTGFIATTAQRQTLTRRGLPKAIVTLLESLLRVNPTHRPACERVLGAIREAKLGRESPENEREAVVVARKPATPPAPAEVVVRRRSPSPREQQQPVVLRRRASSSAVRRPSDELLLEPPENLLLGPGGGAASPDVAPREVLRLLVGRVARIGLLAVKVYALARAAPPPPAPVSALLALLAAADFWTDRPDTRRSGVLALVHFGVMRAVGRRWM